MKITTSQNERSQFQGPAKDYLVGSALTLLFLGSLFAICAGVLELNHVGFSLNEVAASGTIALGVVGLVGTVALAILYISLRTKETRSDQPITQMQRKLKPCYPTLPQDRFRSMNLPHEMIQKLQKKQFFVFHHDDCGLCIASKVNGIVIFHSEKAFEKGYSELHKKGYKEIFITPSSEGWTMGSTQPLPQVIKQHNEAVRAQEEILDRREAQARCAPRHVAEKWAEIQSSLLA